MTTPDYSGLASAMIPLGNNRLLNHPRRRIRRRAVVRLTRRFVVWAKRYRPEEFAEELAMPFRELVREEWEDREASR